MLARAKLALILAVATSVGCEGRVAMKIFHDAGVVVTPPDAGTLVSAAQCPEGTQPRVVELGTPVKLDLLFMIDDSLSMEEEQSNLTRNFPRLMDELKNLPSGFPDLHVGVVSSDLGAGTASYPDACGVTLGDRGRLQVRPDCGVDTSRGRYLISQDGGNTTNFQGDISDVFACIATIGTNGCGFEHQLQSVRMALSGLVNENNGFLRPDAHLAVVYITDEDDCSAPSDTSIFSGDLSGQDSSLRCSLYGHRCNGQPVKPAVFSTPLDDCGADPNGGGKLIPVKTFIDEMKRLRTQSITISVIGGWPTDPANANYAIGYDSAATYNRDLLTSIPICQSANGRAAVGLRLKQFVDAFGAAGKIISICQDDFSTAMGQIGQLINTTVECQ
jgi:hypothetical protein